tara:strand:- start:169 stop:1431 length:1263 start_codon:yes stop_codon:yes gene_type:complete
MTKDSSPISVRYHGLDFMRAAMMLMGILLHVGVMYMAMPYGDDAAGIVADARDPYRDIEGYSMTAQRIAWAVHIFRMPAFMLLAGFFGAMMFQKRGAFSFLKNRFSRIVIPLVIFWILIWPIDRFAWGFGANMILDQESNLTVWENLGNALSLKVLPFVGDLAPHTMHLWFIYQLVYFYVITFLLHSALRKICPRALERVDSFVSSLGKSKAGWIFLPFAVVCTWLVLSGNSTFHFDVSFSWTPPWYIPFAYYQFFFFGWIGYHHLKVIDFAKRNLPWLLPASIGLLALQLYCVEATWSLGSLQEDGSAQSEDFERMKNVTVWSQSCSVWVITLMFIGLCEKLIKRPHRALTFLVGASYWLYLIHRPLCVAFAALFQRWSAPGVLKYALVCTIVTVICLWSYQVMVRRSFVGVLLNGKRM